jgi:hypothetical protein
MEQLPAIGNDVMNMISFILNCNLSVECNADTNFKFNLLNQLANKVFEGMKILYDKNRRGLLSRIAPPCGRAIKYGLMFSNPHPLADDNQVIAVFLVAPDNDVPKTLFLCLIFGDEITNGWYNYKIGHAFRDIGIDFVDVIFLLFPERTEMYDLMFWRLCDVGRMYCFANAIVKYHRSKSSGGIASESTSKFLHYANAIQTNHICLDEAVFLCKETGMSQAEISSLVSDSIDNAWLDSIVKVLSGKESDLTQEEAKILQEYTSNFDHIKETGNHKLVEKLLLTRMCSLTTSKYMNFKWIPSSTHVADEKLQQVLPIMHANLNIENSKIREIFNILACLKLDYY